MKNYISINIDYIIKQNHLTRIEFANKYGVSATSVGYYINEKSFPSIPMIQNICSDFELSIDDFINKDLSKLKKEPHYVQEPETKYQVAEKTIQLYEQLSATQNKVIEEKDAVIETKDALIKVLNKALETKEVLLNQADTLGKVLLTLKADMEIEKAQKENGHT